MKRLYFVLLFFLIVATATAQEKKRSGSERKRKNNAAYNKKNKEDDKFLQKQWWLGFKAGPNLSKVSVDKTYSIVVPTNYEASTIGKNYESYNLMGSQATLEVSFYFKGFTISFQPTYQRSRFEYSNQFTWSDTVATHNVELKYNQEQKLSYAVLPLLVKYDFLTGRLRPYVQIGVYSALLLDATKIVTVSGVDQASGGANEFQNESVIVGAKDLFAKSHWGLLGGVGLNYNLGNNVRLNFDVAYKHGMSNISSTKNRFSSDRLSGVGDALDDLKLDNISVTLGCLFPLRFLSSGFKTLDKK
ncbi:outer membrane beta-barrel protein [Chryseolinea lacunae]|uniref:PorT family protein n=1 Tax=Chryseolinea lacunae TaxID=2801331 RepID=A0ABS1KWF4_9BACT|nr:OmpW family outer membrane protein [Chryseolinea lacunae]MBL0743801.1 PorT family protein [Chryseolinea lacunae]